MSDKVLLETADWAHSPNETGLPERLEDHLRLVAELCEKFALRFKAGSWGKVIAADNDVALSQGQGHNPGLAKATEAAEAIGAQLMVPRFSDQQIEQGLTDFNDQANQSQAEAAAVTGQLTLAIENAAPFALDPERDALLAEGEEGLTPDMSDEEAAAYRARLPANVEAATAPLERNPQLEWDFRIGKNGAIEHFRTEDGRVAVREVADKIHILTKDHDAMALALERALERFGTHLHFDGNQAGARTLVDIVVAHDLRVTFTDDRLNAQIQLRRVYSDLDRGRPIVGPEREQTPTQKRGAGASASGLTPEKKQAVQSDGKLASQHTGEVFVDCGSAPYDFDKRNELNYFVRTVTPEGEQRIHWGKDLPRALEEAGAKVGDSITATRVASKPVTVEEVQEQPDGSKQTVRIDAKRNSWQVDNHGVDRLALIKAYDVLVKTPEDRKKLEISAPLLVAARDQAGVELKREKLAAELAQRNSQNHTLRL